MTNRIFYMTLWVSLSREMLVNHWFLIGLKISNECLVVFLEWINYYICCLMKLEACTNQYIYWQPACAEFLPGLDTAWIELHIRKTKESPKKHSWQTIFQTFISVHFMNNTLKVWLQIASYWFLQENRSSKFGLISEDDLQCHGKTESNPNRHWIFFFFAFSYRFHQVLLARAATIKNYLVYFSFWQYS